TSAPRSESSMQPSGPAMTCVRSRTRTPASGPVLIFAASGLAELWLAFLAERQHRLTLLRRASPPGERFALALHHERDVLFDAVCVDEALGFEQTFGADRRVLAGERKGAG